MRFAVDVVVRRGEIAESRHRVQVAVARSARQARGRDLRPAPGHDVPLRRQAVPAPAAGRARSCRALGLVATSSSRSWRRPTPAAPHHVDLGARDPRAPRAHRRRTSRADSTSRSIPIARARLAAHPEERSALYNNCSGKHAGMLCLALSEGWPTSGYERPDHPVQQLMRATVAELCGLEPEAVAVAVDGCSVSVFGLPLESHGARLRAAGRRHVSRRPIASGRSLASVAPCRRFPRAAGGAGRFSTALMEAPRRASWRRAGPRGWSA